MKRISEILIVSSSEFEVKKIIQKMKFYSEIKPGLVTYLFENLKVDVLISGIGIPATTFKMTKALNSKDYDLILNIGICGSFKSDIPNGTCVNVIQDEFADLGITNSDNSFTTLFEEGFVPKNEFPFKNGKLIGQNSVDYCQLVQVKGITVNAVSGNKKQIEIRKEKFKTDIETMEGAAVAFVCLTEDVDFMQIRSVSNPVEPRNKKNWNISLAIDNLTDEVINILQNINN